jgi:class 3 adenylate cyclase
MTNSKEALMDNVDFDTIGSDAENHNQNMNPSDYFVAFSGNTVHYCVGLVDMVNSTKIAAIIGNEKISVYYKIFLNTMSKILSRFGGFVIKNVGDSCILFSRIIKTK